MAILGIRATLLEGAYHEVDSNPQNFGLAAQEAFWIAMRNARPKVLLRYEW
jgi:translation elongation factor EF-G